MESDAPMQDVIRTTADRLGQMAEVLGRLSDPATLEQLLREVAGGEREILDGLILGMPNIRNKCWWIRDHIHSASCEAVTVEQCDLRDDLTWDERIQVMAIFIKYQKDWQANTGPGIQDGKLLDALKAGGFVTCPLVERAVCHNVIILGPWDHVCIGDDA